MLYQETMNSDVFVTFLARLTDTKNRGSRSLILETVFQSTASKFEWYSR